MNLTPSRSYGVEFLAGGGWVPSALTFTREGEAAGYGQTMRNWGHAYDYRVATFETWASHTFDFTRNTPVLIRENFLQEYTHERLRIQKVPSQKETGFTR